MNQILEKVPPSHRTNSVSRAGFDPPRVNPADAQPPETASPSPALMGIAFDSLTTTAAVARIEQMILSRQPHYAVTANVDFLVQAQGDVELRRLLLDAHLVLCDGTPLLWMSRWLGNPLPERVAGADLVPQLIELAAQKGYRLYFLGGTPEVAAQAVANMRAQHPGLIIAGHYSPPFHVLLEMDQADITRRIREAKPDLLFISFGCPKAEKWLGMNYRTLGVPVGIGVGATIDFLAGQVQRAPRWMQRTGTEWIFRLMQEPRRLMRRYWQDLWVFGAALPRQWWQFRNHRSEDSAVPSVFVLKQQPAWTCITAPARLDIKAVRQDGARWETAAQADHPCLVNMAGVRSVDASGVGLLLSLHKRLRARGQELILIAPGGRVSETLKYLGLDGYFITAPNKATAREQFTRAKNGEEPGVHLNISTLVLEWRGEVTAANADAVWQTTSTEIRSRDTQAGRCDIDLSRVSFMDSTGVGLMVRLRKYAREGGTQLVFTGAKASVRNVLRLSGLEALLLGVPT